jgi:hypothetical protein
MSDPPLEAVAQCESVALTTILAARNQMMTVANGVRAIRFASQLTD